MDINGAKILVTGGAGLIESSAIDLLLRKYLNLLPPTLETVVLRIGAPDLGSSTTDSYLLAGDEHPR